METLMNQKARWELEIVRDISKMDIPIKEKREMIKKIKASYVI